MIDENNCASNITLDYYKKGYYHNVIWVIDTMSVFIIDRWVFNSLIFCKLRYDCSFDVANPIKK